MLHTCSVFLRVYRLLCCCAGQYVPVALALVATLVISCRSVASKTVAALTGTTEYDTFLEASGPG